MGRGTTIGKTVLQEKPRDKTESGMNIKPVDA